MKEFNCCRCGNQFFSKAHNAKKCQSAECQKRIPCQMRSITCSHCGCVFLSKSHNVMRCKAAACQRAGSTKRKRRARAENTEAHKIYLSAWRKRSREKLMLVAVRSRAKKHGIEFSLTESDLKIPKYCPVLGIELGWSDGHAKAASPSVDRIDPSKGYVPDNIMVISHRANRIKSDSQPHEIEAIWRYVMKHHKSETTSEQAGAK